MTTAREQKKLTGDERVARVEAFRELNAGFPSERLRRPSRFAAIRRRALAYITAKRGIA